MSNISDLSDTIVAKSDQLNADDLVTGDKVLTVTKVSRGSAESPITINYDGDDGRPFKPCLTCRRIIMAAWGADGREWVGKQMQVYCDDSVVYAGKEVGGVRIRAMSDLNKPLSVKLAVTRGRKKEYRIDVLDRVEKPDYPQDKFDAALGAMQASIESGKFTAEQVITRCERTGKLSEQQRETIRNLAVADDAVDLMGDE